MTIQVKAIEQFFRVILFIMPYKVDLNFKSGDKTLVCDHSNESYRTVLSCGTVNFAVQGGSKTLVSDHSKARCLAAVFSYGSVTPAVQGACSFRIWMKSKPRILLQSKRKLYRPVELSYKQLSILILGEN